ncbi:MULTISPECIES: hypothetical protein [Rhodococcus]|uniref:Phasin domain-containing protein n=1 Tax=Rhodococcus oxybenzonivorans TaxID=1990687 RepID=A0A2S2BPT4_9NOCA|nr:MULTISPECIES: hypothetical protein [Rhodococcus]AWK70578.1 hypothetical protein CBI38_02340 [Rhodococcus oxybenzonivorans]MDV7242984.1 hypothetical protein [Rhodococcus oxybenzonivorans]MDV7264472.1 hypothetical protein [Rhodococcus oxybenzonivorans]MDV7275388.1 hypothetical protein [Rhodococcus oxybenzonivorans]MDV7334757.1 hypothetical protein [Rhodococcus oxybenzonivorans]
MTTAKTVTDATTAAAAGLSKALDESTERISSLNEKVVDAAKQSGNLSLDTYEKALGSVLEFQEKIGTSSNVEWISSLTKAQVSLVNGISTAFTDAARSVLK